MKSKRHEQLLEFLSQKKEWISAAELARTLGVSTRQVRNYITTINQEAGNVPKIDSSCKGYRLSQRPALLSEDTVPVEIPAPILPAQRNNRIVTKLLEHGNEGYDIFDLSDELFVSIPTLENDLGKIRKAIIEYKLVLRRSHETLFLEGAEKDKRHFIHEYLFQEGWDTELKAQSFFPPIFYDSQIPKTIRGILSEHSIYVNDYTLDDLILHILIAVRRIQSGFCISEIPQSPLESDNRYLYATKDLAEFLQHTFAVSLNSCELYDLELALSDNTSILDLSAVTKNNLNQYIETTYIDTARFIIDQVKEHYLISSFSDDFFIKFTLHLKNLFIRNSKNLTAKNPLKDKIKWAYPLIHDISVFIADILDHKYMLHIDEDEIAYISFHLCTCLYGMNQEPVTATFIYANYYDYYQKTVELLEKFFDGQLAVKFVVPIHDYLPSACHSDLIISTVSSRLPKPCLVINPFPVKQDFDQLRTLIEEIRNLKQCAFFHKHFVRFFDCHCFFINKSLDTPAELIQSMCTQVIDLGFAHKIFLEDVLRREHISDTAFNQIAVPHAMSQHVNRSFISVAINRPPISWSVGAPAVSLVLMIGIHQDDRRIFSRMFDFLVEILSTAGNVSLLEQADTFDEFAELICGMAGDVNWNENNIP